MHCKVGDIALVIGSISDNLGRLVLVVLVHQLDEQGMVAMAIEARVGGQGDEQQFVRGRDPAQRRANRDDIAQVGLGHRLVAELVMRAFEVHEQVVEHWLPAHPRARSPLKPGTKILLNCGTGWSGSIRDAVSKCAIAASLWPAHR